MADRAPEAGDFVWVDFEPVRGTEQGGTRPAIVISATAFNVSGARAIVCPITSNDRPWPTKVALPQDGPVRGFVLTDQVRSVDRPARGFRHVGRASLDTLSAVRRKVAALMSDDFRLN